MKQKLALNPNNNCPLCGEESQVFYSYKSRLYHQCNHCKGIFVDSQLLPNIEDEKSRYQEHQNDVEDKGYQKFVSPITSSILKEFTAQHKGLDFGAGTGPVIAKVLKDHKFSIKLYDPIFHHHPKLLQEKYDYIACCEVIEHFHHPKTEFVLLRNLLNEKGGLFCMTDIYDSTIDFHLWYYKNDPTHVFIYQKETLEWIKEELGFLKMEIQGRLISFYI